jgi:hypothetical protein
VNRLHLRYLIVATVATAATAIGVQWFILTLLDDNRGLLAGAALVGGWWANLATAAVVAIMAGRKSAAGFTDARMGKVLGTAVGVWVGIGAMVGEVMAALVLIGLVPNSDIRPGLIVVFGTVSLIVSVVAAAIAGRETAHPPEVEEEA